jgi:hypothetical protein
MVTGGSENQYILAKFSFEDQYSLCISITEYIRLLHQHDCGYFIPSTLPLTQKYNITRL